MQYPENQIPWCGIDIPNIPWLTISINLGIDVYQLKISKIFPDFKIHSLPIYYFKLSN